MIEMYEERKAGGEKDDLFNALFNY
jgi:hypothetical protein